MMFLTDAEDKLTRTSALVMYRASDVTDSQITYVKDVNGQLCRLTASVTEDGGVNISSEQFKPTADDRNATDWSLAALKNVLKAVKAGDGTRLVRGDEGEADTGAE